MRHPFNKDNFSEEDYNLHKIKKDKTREAKQKAISRASKEA